VLEDYEAALESINDFRGKPRGQLRVTIAEPAADLYYWLRVFCFAD
jgi:hypothetical protein